MTVGELRQQHGFTLIELLVTLVIASIIAIVAVPAFTGFLARQQLVGDVNEMISVLSLARSEAIKQRQPITVQFSPPNAPTRRPSECGGGGERYDEDDPNDNPRYVYLSWCYWVESSDSDDEVLRVVQSSNIAMPDQAFSLTFQNLGDADIDDCRADPSQPCRITLGPQRDDIASVTLAVNITGSIRRKELER